MTRAPAIGRYTRVAITLHWMIAALILFNLAIGFFMESFSPAFRGLVLRAHISAGMTVLLLTGVRVVWRLMHEPPPFPATMKQWERHTAHFVHFGLYMAMLLMPLIGWAIISAHSPKGSLGAAVEAAKFAAAHPKIAASGAPPAAAKAPGRPNPMPAVQAAGSSSGPMLWWLIRFPLIKPIEDIGESVGGVEPQKVLHEKFIAWHSIGGYLTILLLLLHVLGALKHQFLDDEPEFERMGVR